MAGERTLLIGELLRRRGAGGGCHRNAPFVFIVNKIGLPILLRVPHWGPNQFVVSLPEYRFCIMSLGNSPFH